MPAEGSAESLESIRRIFWMDDDQKSVQGLAEVLKLKDRPSYVVAFFPKTLEDDLLKKELAFANRKESEIKATRFKVVKKGDAFEPVVVSQEARKP